MIHELVPPASARVRRLFEPLSFHVSCASVLSGSNPGRAFVDDPHDPTAGFVLSPEAAYVAGDAGASDFCTSLGSFLGDPANLGVPMWDLVLVASSERWAECLGEMAADHGIARDARRHYECDRGRSLRPLPSPPGATPVPIDERFLQGDACAVPEHVRRWICHNWGSADHFLSVGFGMATLCNGEVVAWSVADCATEGSCEIGIRTAPAWRGQGLAAFTANRAILHAFSIGMTSVGWHCHEENVASWRTAERAGFVLERVYEEYRILEPSETVNARPTSEGIRIRMDIDADCSDAELDDLIVNTDVLEQDA